MVRAVIQRDFDVDDRIAGNDTGLERFFDALLDRFDVLAWNRAADDLVFEDEAGAWLERRNPQPDVAVLTASAGLTNKSAVRLGILGDRFAICDLRLADL